MSENTEKELPKEVKIYYEKSLQHRTVGITGAWVGITPTLAIQLALYNDLRPMPEFVSNKVTAEGQLGEETEKLEKTGIVRETEITVTMPPPVAVELIRLLQQMLNQIEGFKSPNSQNVVKE